MTTVVMYAVQYSLTWHPTECGRTRQESFELDIALAGHSGSQNAVPQVKGTPIQSSTES